MTNQLETQQSGLQQQQNAVVQQQPQQQNLYQRLASMTPQQMVELRTKINFQKGQKEVFRNVGEKRGADLITQVNIGQMSMPDAINRSKAELTPMQKSIDNEFFRQGSTSQDMLSFRDRSSATWTSRERNQWFGHYSRKLTEELKSDVADVTADKSQTAAQKVAFAAQATNTTNLLKAQTDYTGLETAIYNATKGLFKTDKYGRIIETDGFLSVSDVEIEKDGKKVRVPSMNKEDMNVMQSSWKTVTEEIQKDLNQATVGQGDQSVIARNLSVIANLVPMSYLRNKRGFVIGNEFIPIPKEVKDESSLRKLFLDSMLQTVRRAKDHVANVKPVYELQQQQEQPQQQQQEIPTIGSGADYDALPSGTIFIDPSGQKRRKP
jgi:hypothetical protein